MWRTTSSSILTNVCAMVTKLRNLEATKAPDAIGEAANAERMAVTVAISDSAFNFTPSIHQFYLFVTS
jgi:hypothetical protein